ncbi:MAG: alpha-L-fucosidase [Verrucomicrobia bacterium]|nr:alpha-L-fucosidase [Verrucomicrobiota bacterium]
MTRRKFTRIALAALGLRAIPLMAGETTGYTRANTDWLAKCRYGIGVHWTAQTVPRNGDLLSFQRAVDAFKLKEFVEQVRLAGANYVLFTAAHALQMLPAPHPVIDRILPGRTCKRDLIGELADALAVHGLPLIIYWNHSCNGRDDPEWRKAVGYDGQDKTVLAKNLIAIVAWMGQRYSDKIKAWWFDSPYSLDPRGSHNSVTTDMTGFQFPWEQFTVAAKTGFPGRLVTYNAGVAQTYLYTTHQDYWAGELVNLKAPATSRHLDNGLQWFGWTCLDHRGWVHTKRNTEIPKPLYSDEEVAAFVRVCNAHQAPMTFNVGIYQDGTMASASVEQLRRLGASLRS